MTKNRFRAATALVGCLAMGACSSPDTERVATTEAALLPAAAILWGQVMMKAIAVFKEHADAQMAGMSPMEKRLATIEELMVKAQQQLTAMRAAINDVGSAVARAQNNERLEQLAQIESQVVGIKASLAWSPGPPDWRLDRDTAQLLSQLELANNAQVWEWSTWSEGPGEVVEFRHQYAFPVYASALALRLTFLETRVPAEVVRTRYAAELRAHADFLGTRIGWREGNASDPPGSVAEKVREGVFCHSTTDSEPHEGACGYMIECRDRGLGITYPGQYTEILQEGFDECLGVEAAAMQFEPEKETTSGVDVMDEIADRVRSMAASGRLPGTPLVGVFGRAPEMFWSVALGAPLFASATAAPGDSPAPRIRRVSVVGPPSPDFQFLVDVDGSVRHQASGLCLDVLGASNAAGESVVLWSCHGGAGQRWSKTSSGGRAELKNINSGMCLTASTRFISGRPMGTRLSQEPCNNRDAQAFTGVEPGWYPPVN